MKLITCACVASLIAATASFGAAKPPVNLPADVYYQCNPNVQRC